MPKPRPAAEPDTSPPLTTESEPAPADGSPMLTVEEIALELRVDVVTVRRWITDGHVWPAYKVGKAFRVPRRSLDHFLNRAQVIVR